MNRRWIIVSVLTLDVLWLVLALGVSYRLRYSGLHPYPPAFYRLLILSGVGTWVVLFRTMRLDGFDGGWRLAVMGGRIATATVLLMAIVLTIAYLDQLYYSRLLLSYFSLLLFAGFLLIRVGVYLFLRTQRQRGLTRRVVLVGNNRITREFAFKIQRYPELLYEMVGTLYPSDDGSPDAAGDFSPNGNLLSSIDVLEILERYRVDEVIVLEHTPGVEFQTFVTRCRDKGVNVNVLPRSYELYTSKPKLIEIGGLPLIALEGPTRVPFASAIKRAMDIVLLLPLAAPAALILCIAGTVLLIKKGSVMRREVRIGKDGRPFSMYRLDIDRKGNDGPPYERLLRDLSISELPQLWNVLRGDMSLVGPRPESPERVKHYSEWQRERLRAMPGMTGLAQANGLREEHSSEEKTRFDLEYLLEWSPIMDLALLLQTLGTLVERCFGHQAAADTEFPEKDHSPAVVPAHAGSPRGITHANRA